MIESRGKTSTLHTETRYSYGHKHDGISNTRWSPAILAWIPWLVLHLPKFEKSDRNYMKTSAEPTLLLGPILLSDTCILNLYWYLQHNLMMLCSFAIMIFFKKNKSPTRLFVFSMSFCIWSNPENLVSFHWLSDLHTRNRRPYKSLNMRNLIKTLNISKFLLWGVPKATLNTWKQHRK